jgi:hypothetical protein
VCVHGEQHVVAWRRGYLAWQRPHRIPNEWRQNDAPPIPCNIQVEGKADCARFATVVAPPVCLMHGIMKE